MNPVASLILVASSFVALAVEPVVGLVARGDALDKQLKTKEALAVFLEAARVAPGDAEVLRRVAKGYAEQMPDTPSKSEKRVLGEKALEYAQRAVVANPKNGTAHLALAICYGRLAPLLDNRTKIAYSKLVKEHAERSVSLDPSNDYAYHVLGAWHYELASLNPVLRAVVRLVYGALPPASYDEAVRLFKKAIAMEPGRVSHHVELGRTYAAMGDTELARAELNRGVALPSREKDDVETKERARDALRKL